MPGFLGRNLWRISLGDMAMSINFWRKKEGLREKYYQITIINIDRLSKISIVDEIN